MPESIDPIALSVSNSPVVNVPNALTAARLAITPLFAWMVATADGDTTKQWASAVIFLVAALTDLADGYIARRDGIVTSFGKIADPIADKLLTGSALVLLSRSGDLAWWVTVTILSREVLITLVRFAVIRRGIIPASRGGKIKTASQVTAIVVYLAPLGRSWQIFAEATMGLAVVLTLATGVDYLLRARSLARVTD